MNTETIPPASISTEETHPLSLPLFLSSSSSSLKPLRERNRTNLKRRINLSRSQVLSNDFENEDNLPTMNSIDKIKSTTTNSQPQPSTPTLHTYTEMYSKTISPTTPSPIHTTVTCSQVWERLASNEEHQTSTSPKSVISPPPPPTATTTTTTVSTSSLPTHISFSYDPSDDEAEGENLSHDGFQYVPVSSQSKLVRCQFITFARQQQLVIDNDEHDNEKSDDEDEDEDEDNDEDDDEITGHNVQGNEEEDGEQENQISKKRKRSVSTTDSLDDISVLPTAGNSATASSSVTKPPCTKKPKIKDPNANFQRLNMRRKNFSHAKKHQFAKHKRNAFYRRTRHAGGNK